MNPPHTYASWVDCLELFESEQDDSSALLAMEAGTLDWTPGVAERIATVIQRTFEARLTRLVDRIQMDLRRCAGTDLAISNVLLMGRRRAVPLRRLATLKSFPEYVRQHFEASLDGCLKQAQAALEDSALTDRSGRLGSLIRKHPLHQLPDATSAPVERAEPIKLTSRRVIL